MKGEVMPLDHGTRGRDQVGRRRKEDAVRRKPPSERGYKGLWLTPGRHKDMSETAAELGLTLPEYLWRLHQHYPEELRDKLKQGTVLDSQRDSQ